MKAGIKMPLDDHFLGQWTPEDAIATAVTMLYGMW